MHTRRLSQSFEWVMLGLGVMVLIDGSIIHLGLIQSLNRLRGSGVQEPGRSRHDRLSLAHLKWHTPATSTTYDETSDSFQSCILMLSNYAASYVGFKMGVSLLCLLID